MCNGECWCGAEEPDEEQTAHVRSVADRMSEEQLIRLREMYLPRLPDPDED